MVGLFFLISFVVFAAVGGIATVWSPILWSLILFVPLFLMGVNDVMQKRQAVRRNFPILGNLRYFFEMIRPELQQYFVESNHNGRPIAREWRSVVYQRSKGQLETLPFGTQRDLNTENHEWVHHSMNPQKVKDADMRVMIGGPDCKQPYCASRFNISAMSYGSLSKNAIMALNGGAKLGNFFHNTGEGGISPYHKQGGDLCWQIGTGYFGCRTPEGNFCENTFSDKSRQEQVKMIEIKISQGAKPGKGGILPGEKVTPEIAEIRGVEVGKDVISPSKHSAFSNPSELLDFIQKLRDLSGGKPIGFKFCVGRRSEFFGICKAMVEKKIYPDFISVDGAEGGTGAAPLEFSNSVGRPLDESLSFVVNSLIGFGVRDKIKVIAAGKVFSSFGLLSKLALGADAVNSARGMMLALGCIQALKCNSNHCPVGVATTNPALYRGLHVPSKALRVSRYHDRTLEQAAEILGAMGYTSPEQIKRSDIFRRLTNGMVRSFEEIFPSMSEGSLLEPDNLDALPQDLVTSFLSSRSDAFWGTH